MVLPLVNQVSGRDYAPDALGRRVDRAAATLPQGATDEALFTITGGRVLLRLIVGEVTVLIETQANTTKLKFNPTATGADQDLCATLDISADAVGTLYTISGGVGDALRDDLLIGAGNLVNDPLILSEGDIELDCGDGGDGEIAWSLWYTPLDDGAQVVAA